MKPEIGDPAPDFTLPGDGDAPVALKALRGKTVIVYFYPKDDTPGCTVEACDFRDGIAAFARAKAEVIGISRDTPTRHDKFKAKHELPFRLASDEDAKVCKAYGVWQEKKMAGKTGMGIVRSTFLIDGKGVVRGVWRGVKVAGHVAEVLKTAKAL